MWWRILVGVLAWWVVPGTGRVAAQDTTSVVVLGVTHAGMLLAESYQPAVFRAYFDRVQPDAICVERSPEEFARGSHYEFTYEIQSIIVPYARAEGIPVCPFDWLPGAEDMLLGFGVNLDVLPFLRQANSYASFLAFDDQAALRRSLFYAESPQEREQYRAWYGPMPDRPRTDFARRLFLYRTFMQAMRIARAARQHPGGRVLVVVGSMHKDDIERILKDQPGIRVVPPDHFGPPADSAIARQTLRPDLLAIAGFNLLGVQSSTGNVDWRWLQRVLNRLAARDTSPEVRLLQTRLAVLTNAISAENAALEYRRIRELPGSAVRFTWDGVLDRSRVDSFADPFANLTVRQRAMIEEARELIRAGRQQQAEAIRDELGRALGSLQSAQVRAYWEVWLGK